MARSVIMIAVSVFATLIGIGAVQSNAQINPVQSGLWAGISVPKAMFNESEASKLQVSFVVVNDGTTTINPKIGASHLSINGVEPKDWPMIINNGLRSPEFEALPPGHDVSFGYLLGGRYFAKPGIYTVRWWGEKFRAEPITFRVMPDKR